MGYWSGCNKRGGSEGVVSAEAGPDRMHKLWMCFYFLRFSSPHISKSTKGASWWVRVRLPYICMEISSQPLDWWSWPSGHFITLQHFKTKQWRVMYDIYPPPLVMCSGGKCGLSSWLQGGEKTGVGREGPKTFADTQNTGRPSVEK